MRLSFAAVLLVLVACQHPAAASPVPTANSTTATSSPTSTDQRQATPAATPTLAIDPVSALTFVNLADLPVEAADTVDLINSHGPFPYSQDGAVFQNREGLLPDEPSGYYHEYTVKTPGSPDRGARRIITGADGALYYTSDHYDSFERIRDE
ncbi:MAG TPA: ribonuclease domain-containing protein [Candidatus Limnocylindria bacterium]|nr:ribonuclease domain-containing protein [Candidatus Limnocylindria bacterium]